MGDEDKEGAEGLEGADEEEAESYLRELGLEMYGELGKLTAGLNRPPLIPKNAQTLIPSEKPKDGEM